MVTTGRKFTTFNNCKQFHYFISIITRRNILNTLFLPYKICRIQELQGASPPLPPPGLCPGPTGGLNAAQAPCLKLDAPLSSNLGSTPANAKSRIVTLFTNECPTYCISGPTDIAAIEKIGHWVTMVLTFEKAQIFLPHRTDFLHLEQAANKPNKRIYIE